MGRLTGAQVADPPAGPWEADVTFDGFGTYRVRAWADGVSIATDDYRTATEYRGGTAWRDPANAWTFGGIAYTFEAWAEREDSPARARAYGNVGWRLRHVAMQRAGQAFAVAEPTKAASQALYSALRAHFLAWVEAGGADVLLRHGAVRSAADAVERAEREAAEAAAKVEAARAELERAQAEVKAH